MCELCDVNYTRDNRFFSSAFFQSSSYPLSGNANIDAMLILNGFGGPRNSSPGTPVTVYYTFDATTQPGLSTYTSAQQANISSLVARFEAAAGIDFVLGANPTTGNYDLAFYIGQPGSGGSYWPNQISLASGAIASGYVEVHSNKLDDLEFLLLHETGHALGLDHPANYTGFESAPHLDSNQITNFSIMGYGDDSSDGLSANDIAALQYLYGPVGGAQTLVVNLTEASDIHNGSSRAESISGFGGNDAIYGEGASDTIGGNAGNDTIFGGSGADVIFGGRDADSILGNSDADLINGNLGNDSLFGGQGNDVVYGGADNDFILGNLDNDSINGDRGDDTLYGGSGNDTLSGGSGNDLLSGDAGENSVSGGDGQDVFVMKAGVQYITDFTQNQDIIRIDPSLGASIAQALAGASGNVVSLGAATIFLQGFSGTLTASDFALG